MGQRYDDGGAIVQHVVERLIDEPELQEDRVENTIILEDDLPLEHAQEVTDPEWNGVLNSVFMGKFM